MHAYRNSKEIKPEHRVSLTPKSVKALLEHKHEVFVENNAGLGIGSQTQTIGTLAPKSLTLQNMCLMPPS